MLDFLIFLNFIVSVALAAGGVVISSKMRKGFRHDMFSNLLYYQVFIYTFGFYGIWGQVAINAFLSGYISPDLLNRFLDIAMLMGLPFLVFAWLMLLQFSFNISGRQYTRWFASLFLLANFSVLLFVGYLVAKAGIAKPASLIRYYFLCMNFAYTLSSSLLLLIPGKRPAAIQKHDRKIIAFILMLVMIIQGVPLLLYTSQAYIAVIFILAFFTGNTVLPLYLNYGTLLSCFPDENKKDISLDDFCRRFEVSPRETDIVREICNGLSNKEISDKLFISLQTVKDHTHRIYIKTNVRSRVQLINLVKESVSS